MKNQLIRLSINLTQVQLAKAIKKSKKGNLFIDVVVTGRKAPDAYGNDVTAYLNQTEEEQRAKVDKIYVGHGKNYIFQAENDPANLTGASEADTNWINEMQDSIPTPESNAPVATPQDPGDDLPF